MPQPQITVRNLSKTYHVPERAAGLHAAIRSLVHRPHRLVHAVRDITFEIGAGEIVGFLGANGAGKTTTLKILAGLLYPTAGEVRVAGYVPHERKPPYLRRISMVLGNKSQMLWDIPPLDSFRVLGEIYRVPRQELKHTLDELIELLEMEALLRKPVRNLSLGERMKCELVAGLLYRPDVLFLDEPTLGLDVSMQGRLRQFIAEYNRRTGATVLLTSHYMADVIALCPRVIFIHHGGLLYDGALSELAQRLAPFKLIRIALQPDDTRAPINGALPADVTVIEQNNGHVTLRVDRAQAPALTATLLQTLPVADLVVEDPPIEAVLDQLYGGGAV